MTETLYRITGQPVTNEDRAIFARAAVEAFREVCSGSSLYDENGDFNREGVAEAIGDLIGNLMHLAALANLDPIGLIQHGVSHYECERRWPPDGFGPASDRIDVSVCVTIDSIAHGLAKQAAR
jgi:hypothetical protein